MKKLLILCMAILSFNSIFAKPKTVKLRIIETSDVHGCFFPYDFINRKPKNGSLARAITYIDSLRKEYGSNLLLFDNGDILQGQPTCYYCNYINPNIPNVAAEVVNYMRYDAQTIGNHDIETGHEVYDKWIRELDCPVLGANIIDTKTEKPYVSPYAIFKREGIKIAVIGMLTPAIPNWLRESLWSGMRFDDIVSSARHWVDYLKSAEKPDIIIGLFHSGKEGGIKTSKYEEDATIRVAQEVPGFDLILFGHDHAQHNIIVKNCEGKDVLCLNPSANAYMVADAQINIQVDRKGRILQKDITGEVVNIEGQEIDENYMKRFEETMDSVSNFIHRPIGIFEESIYSRDCYFGNAPFTDFIHDLQLQITGADISFNAPLAFDISIQKGVVYVSDMFNLYRYENQIYVLRLTGEEIRKHLEMSYDLWVNTMQSPDDHIMLLGEYNNKETKHYGFKNLAFNFDSAAGIDYEVDVTKPNGEKVRILRMSNGEPFNDKQWYRVAMNSYRGNGGGELLTKGAGIPKEELVKRIVFESDRDQRYYLMREIERMKTVKPKAHNNWRFVPEEWVKPAIERDKAIIFPNKKEE